MPERKMDADDLAAHLRVPAGGRAGQAVTPLYRHPVLCAPEACVNPRTRHRHGIVGGEDRNVGVQVGRLRSVEARIDFDRIFHVAVNALVAALDSGKAIDALGLP